MLRENMIITKKEIDPSVSLKYLIVIPCVNREERNAINVIDATFASFEKSGLFESAIDFHILLFESGSKDTSYLQGILQKYGEHVRVIYTDLKLNGVTNTFKMFFYLRNLPANTADIIIWMDDDVWVCKRFIENADIWCKRFLPFSIFSSLYISSYATHPIPKNIFAHTCPIGNFYGTCCTVFKPALVPHVLPHWFNSHFEQFDYNPDTRFRDSVRRSFPSIQTILVSSFSYVEHMNIGSAIQGVKIIKKGGHKAKFFIGEENDPNIIPVKNEKIK